MFAVTSFVVAVKTHMLQGCNRAEVRKSCKTQSFVNISALVELNELCSCL